MTRASRRGTSTRVDCSGREFELRFVEGVCLSIAGSGEAAWRLLTDCDGVAKSAAAKLSQAERDALQRDWVGYFERHRVNGQVSVLRPFVLILGCRLSTRAGGRR